MHGDRVNYIYCDDHFAIYKNVELLHCILETNIMSYVNYIAIKKNYLQKKKKLSHFMQCPSLNKINMHIRYIIQTV